MIEVTWKQIKQAEPIGEYKETRIDQLKKSVDFRLININPIVIAWKDGKVETINKRQLSKFQKSFTWISDF